MKLRFVGKMGQLGLSCVLAVAAVASSTAHAAVNLVTNGSFETNGGVGQLAGGITTLGSWTVGPAIVTANTPAGSAVFDFLMNGNADSQGFPSVFSPPNIFLWGPNTPASAGGPKANGFTGSPDGGMFFGVDGGYATALLSQTLTGLTVGDQYTVSFQYAGSQFSQYFGATQQDWKVTFGSDTFSTPVLSVPSTGFSGWKTYSTTVTASSTSEVLSFLAQGTPVGIPPTTLLDSVSVTPAAVPEPASLAMLGVVALGLLRRRRSAAC